MPVIGRLDDQVEAVIINPIGGRRKPEEAEPEQPAVPPVVSEERDDPDSTSKKREAESALPVWML